MTLLFIALVHLGFTQLQCVYTASKVNLTSLDQTF